MWELDRLFGGARASANGEVSEERVCTRESCSHMRRSMPNRMLRTLRRLSASLGDVGARQLWRGDARTDSQMTTVCTPLPNRV
jgi:hypothetical protein